MRDVDRNVEAGLNAYNGVGNSYYPAQQGAERIPAACLVRH